MAETTFLIGLGATKAGTSWLYDYLARHPECHFRSVKELHYFSMITPQHFEKTRTATRMTIAEVEAQLVRANDDRKPYLRQKLVDLADWMQVLAHGEINLAAYCAYLNAGAGASTLVGDITPAYSLMSGDRLRLLRRVGVNMRFVYLIRDPVARLWSHVRMIAERNTGKTDFASAAIAGLQRILSGDLSAEGRGIVRRGDYARSIAKLKQAFDAKDLWIQCQENLMTEPGIRSLSGFLGIATRTDGLERRVHEGRSLVLPADLAEKARLFLRPQYEFVARLIPDLPQAWRTNIDKGFA